MYCKLCTDIFSEVALRNYDQSNKFCQSCGAKRSIYNKEGPQNYQIFFKIKPKKCEKKILNEPKKENFEFKKPYPPHFVNIKFSQ